ncbi:hypothetical protein [Agromyces laixinhei]|uniref:hypothetical protein n=1 Tax=Agromyces laixinhei TaxID=2585717 RepID=UPI0012ECEBCC|nr:hypothetical protein [Agromyces laixinhei]
MKSTTLSPPKPARARASSRAGERATTFRRRVAGPVQEATAPPRTDVPYGLLDEPDTMSWLVHRRANGPEPHRRLAHLASEQAPAPADTDQDSGMLRRPGADPKMPAGG